jgi:putative spermidine/putrescine transport system ATP-binding protein
MSNAGTEKSRNDYIVNAYLDLDRIEVAYGGTTALHPLSLGIQRGEFFCLLGPSGCGKSTTLGVVAGFLPTSGGHVFLDGKDVTSLPPQARQIGVVFQNYALFPHMTIADNVGYGLKMQKRERREIDARVESLLKLVRLDGKAERYPRQISGGEQQRVAIARALAIEPRLLLLDEPLSNLDARLREEMRSELKRIQRTTGVTTVFVTHDQEEAFGVGDRIAVLNQGRLEQVGTPTDIYRCPKTSFVAKFIGRSNRLRGQLSSDAKTLNVNGHTFRSGKRENTVAAKSHILFLRPEEVLLSLVPEHPNTIKGTVSEIIYGGAVVNYRICCDLGEMDACRLAGQGPVFAVGDEVHIGWEPESGALLPDDHD